MTAIDHQTLIAELDGSASVAEAIGQLPVTVRAWAARNRIPPEHWPALIVFAATKGVVVTAEWLMNTTPARSRPDSPDPFQPSSISTLGSPIAESGEGAANEAEAA